MFGNGRIIFFKCKVGIMTDKEIIEEALKFLVVDYGFTYEYHSQHNGNEEFYKFVNEFGYFQYYEWSQFKDSEFSVVCNQEFKIIRLFDEYPQIFSMFNKRHKGVKWFFKDQRKDYWTMIASILRLEIKTKGSLFGLKIL